MNAKEFIASLKERLPDTGWAVLVFDKRADALEDTIECILRMTPRCTWQRWPMHELLEKSITWAGETFDYDKFVSQELRRFPLPIGGDPSTVFVFFARKKSEEP